MGKKIGDTPMTTFVELKENLISKIVDACDRHLVFLVDELAGQSVFSYVLLCTSGCRNFSAAACTRDGLAAQNALMPDNGESYNEVNAVEWNYTFAHVDLFKDIDLNVDQIYEIFYEGELEDIDLGSLGDLWPFISGFFVEVSKEVFLRLRNSSKFDDSCFEHDLLVGLQFTDPDEYAEPMILEVSRALNSLEWNKKIEMIFST
jgi:hypothetical protein